MSRGGKSSTGFYGRNVTGLPKKETSFYGTGREALALDEEVTEGFVSRNNLHAQNYTWSKAHMLVDDADRRKFSPNKDPLETEDGNRYMQGWAAMASDYALHQMKSDIEELVKPKNGQPPSMWDQAQLLAYGREFVKGKKRSLESRFHNEFAHRFREWLRGNGSSAEYEAAGMKTYVGDESKRNKNKPISDHPTVLDYLEQWQTRVLQYDTKKAKMKLRMGRGGAPGEAASIEDLWKYYKFVVYGLPCPDIPEQMELFTTPEELAKSNPPGQKVQPQPKPQQPPPVRPTPSAPAPTPMVTEEAPEPAINLDLDMKEQEEVLKKAQATRELEEKVKAEEEAQKKAAEEEAARKKELEAKAKAEEEAKKKAEEEAKKKAEEEAKRKFEEESRRREEEAKKKAEEDQRAREQQAKLFADMQAQQKALLDALEVERKKSADLQDQLKVTNSQLGGTHDHLNNLRQQAISALEAERKKATDLEDQLKVTNSQLGGTHDHLNNLRHQAEAEVLRVKQEAEALVGHHMQELYNTANAQAQVANQKLEEMQRIQAAKDREIAQLKAAVQFLRQPAPQVSHVLPQQPPHLPGGMDIVTQEDQERFRQDNLRRQAEDEARRQREAEENAKYVQEVARQQEMERMQKRQAEIAAENERDRAREAAKKARGRTAERPEDTPVRDNKSLRRSGSVIREPPTPAPISNVKPAAAVAPPPPQEPAPQFNVAGQLTNMNRWYAKHDTDDLATSDLVGPDTPYLSSKPLSAVGKAYHRQVFRTIAEIVEKKPTSQDEWFGDATSTLLPGDSDGGQKVDSDTHKADIIKRYVRYFKTIQKSS